MNRRCKKVVVDKIVKEWMTRICQKIGHLNDLDGECINKNLTPDEFLEVYEKILGGVVKKCESQIKNSFSRKTRFAQEKEKFQKSQF